jgi:hypothetical protein
MKRGRPRIPDHLRKLHGLGPVPRKPKPPAPPVPPQRPDDGLCPDAAAPWCTPDSCALCPSWDLQPSGGDSCPWSSLRDEGNWPKGWPTKVSRETLTKWLLAHADGVVLVPGEYTKDGKCPDRAEPWCHEAAGCQGCPSLACEPSRPRGPWVKLRASRRWPTGWPGNRNMSFDAMTRWLDSRR